MSAEAVSAVKRRIERSADILGVVERYVTAFLLTAMTVLYAFNVFIRFALPMYASTFAWIEEAARWFMIWIAFLAAGVTLEVGRHISIDLIHARLSPQIARVLFKIIDVVGLAFSVLMAVYSINLVVFVAGSGQVSPTLGLPAYIIYVAPVIGFASLAFRFLLRLTNVRDARETPVQQEWLQGAEL